MNENIASLLAILNLMNDELQIEELTSIDEARNLIPIIIKLIKSGDLTFVCDLDYSFLNAVEFIRNDLDEYLAEDLRPDIADEGNIEEISYIILALLYSLHLKQERKFREICDKLSQIDSFHISNMIEQLDNLGQKSPLSYRKVLENVSELYKNGKNKILTSGNMQIFATPFTPNGEQLLMTEDASKYKVRAAELETKLKQVEALNLKLNEQLGMVQNEYNELENRFEVLKQTQTMKQESFDQLQARFTDISDELETTRYQNSQLQREVKSATDRCTRITQKSIGDLKTKEDENKLLYTRLDELVKQLTEKESLTNKICFMEQQLANQQGTINELRDGLKEALSRANSAEEELRKQTNCKKQTSNRNVVNDDSTNANISSLTATGSALSLHEELNSTYQSAYSHDSFNNSHESVNFQISSNGEDFAEVRTRLELLQIENRQLKKTNEEDKQKMEAIQNAEAQTMLEKAKEIEKLKQECESSKNELQKLRQKENATHDRNKGLEDEQMKLNIKVTKLEEALDKAAHVIEEYSTAAGEHCSVAELIQVKHERDQLHAENQMLLSKMDQFKHESTQEQRLITTSWYEAQREIFRLRHCLGVSSTSSSMRSSLVDNLRSATPNHAIITPQHPSPPSSSEHRSQFLEGSLNQSTSSSTNTPTRAHSQLTYNQNQKSLYRRMDAATTSSFPFR